MSSPYVGEIRMFGGNFPPAGWMFCDGSTLPISENEVLFQLIGTTYGGDGQSTFQLPDLRGRVPVHQGQGGGLSNYVIGQKAGVETVTITAGQTPNHGHLLSASTETGDQVTPENNVPASSFNVTPYINDVTDSNFAPNAIGPAGGSQPHENMQPFLCISYIISLFGIFPSQN